MHCSPPDSSPWDLPAKNTGMGCHFLLHGIFPTQRSNSLLHWQAASLPLNHLKVKVARSCLTLFNPMDCSLGQNTGVGSFPLLQVIFPIQGSNPGLTHCRLILYQLSHLGSPYSSYSHVNKKQVYHLCGLLKSSFFLSFGLTDFKRTFYFFPLLVCKLCLLSLFFQGLP